MSMIFFILQRPNTIIVLLHISSGKNHGNGFINMCCIAELGIKHLIFDNWLQKSI